MNHIEPEIIEGLVSTIIPVYNRPQMLREAVQSVLEQTYRPIEIIIVDDGSTDDTVQVAEALASRHADCIKLIKKVNDGPGLAREAGRLIVRGEFIQYLDSDDLLLPQKFEWQVEGLRKHPECGVAYGWTRYRHADGHVEPGPWKDSGLKIETMFPRFLLSRWWDTPTPLYRRILCDLAGPWSDLRLEEDWEYDCRISALGVQLYYVDNYVAEVRDHENQRLCRGSSLDTDRMKARARSHKMIFGHALSAGINVASVEMQHYARELFLLSRQCGAAGLPEESRELFSLALQASGPQRSKRLDFKLYRLAVGVLGWSLAGRLASRADRLRT